MSNRIKELRESQGVSQAAIASELKVNLRTFQRWESGESAIREKNAQKLADYFGVSVAYLLGYDNDKIIETLNKGVKKLKDQGIIDYDELTKIDEASKIIENHIGKDSKKWNILKDTLKEKLRLYPILTKLLYLEANQQNNRADLLINYQILDEKNQNFIFELVQKLADTSILLDTASSTVSNTDNPPLKK